MLRDAIGDARTWYVQSVELNMTGIDQRGANIKRKGILLAAVFLPKSVTQTVAV